MMNDEIEFKTLHGRILELEGKVDFLFKHLNLQYVRELNEDEMKVGEILRKGDFTKAIYAYREIYNVDLGTAKKGVEEIKAKLKL